MVLSAWLQFIATILVLIGSAIFSSGTLNGVSAGAIVLLTGFTMWGHAILIAFGISYIVSTVVVLMPDVLQRQYAWSGIVATLFLLVQFILLNLGSVLLVVRDPPGVWLTAGLLYLIGSIYGLVGWAISHHGAYGYFTPILGFVTGALATSTALAGLGVGAGLGAATGAGLGAGATMAGKGVPGGYGTTGAVPGTTMGTSGAMPGTTMGTTGMSVGPGTTGYSTTPTSGLGSTVPMMGTTGTTPTNLTGMSAVPGGTTPSGLATTQAPMTTPQVAV